MADDDALDRLRHDLRAPLTIVVGFSELLARDQPLSDDERRDYASRVLDAARELRSLIDDV